MSSVVTAMYETSQEAEHAARALKAAVPLAYLDIFDGSEASLRILRGLDLTPEERRTCEGNIAEGGFLLLAQARSGEDPARIIAVLESATAERPPRQQDRLDAQARSEGREDGSRVVAEERLPIIEEELRVGTREVIRGGARVRTRVEDVPFVQDVELLEEFVRVESRPVNRRISDQEIQDAGLLRDRVIEIAQVREEAVVSKESFVREEVIVTKTTEHRVEQIRETLRHTEVETENLRGTPAAITPK